MMRLLIVAFVCGRCGYRRSRHLPASIDASLLRDTDPAHPRDPGAVGKRRHAWSMRRRWKIMLEVHVGRRRRRRTRA